MVIILTFFYLHNDRGEQGCGAHGAHDAVMVRDDGWEADGGQGSGGEWVLGGGQPPGGGGRCVSAALDETLRGGGGGGMGRWPDRPTPRGKLLRSGEKKAIILVLSQIIFHLPLLYHIDVVLHSVETNNTTAKTFCFE